MPRFRHAVVLAAAAVAVSLADGQDAPPKPKDTKPPAATEAVPAPAAAPTDPAAKARYKGQLPPGWKALGLSEEQKQKVYAVAAKYDGQIAELKAKLAELADKKRQEQFDVLTPDQRKRLSEGPRAKAAAQ